MKKLSVLICIIFAVFFTSCVSTSQPLVEKEITITNKCPWSLSAEIIYPNSISINSKYHKQFGIGKLPEKQIIVTGNTLRLFIKSPYDSVMHLAVLKDVTDLDEETEWLISWSTYDNCYLLFRGEKKLTAFERFLF